MKDLLSQGLRGRLPNFIKDFLLDRKFKFESDQPFVTSTSRKWESLKGIISKYPISIKKKLLNASILKLMTTLMFDDFCATSRSKYIRTVNATMHPENQSIGKYKRFQDLQRQNSMHVFSLIEKKSIIIRHSRLTEQKFM